MRLLVARAVEIVVLKNGCGEGLGFRVASREGLGFGLHIAGKSAAAGRQRRDDSGRPNGVRSVRIHIHIDPFINAGRAQAFETGVDLDAALAEIGITGVAESEHRVGERFETGRGIAHQPGVEF